MCELLMYSRDTCGILVRDPGAKPVVPFALPVSFVDSFSAQLDVKFDCYDVVLVPEPGRCFESCPVVFSDPSQMAWLLKSTMVFPSGAGFHAMDCVSSLVLDASSSWDCALPVLQPTARGYNQKDQKQIWKVKEGPPRRSATQFGACAMRSYRQRHVRYTIVRTTTTTTTTAVAILAQVVPVRRGCCLSISIDGLKSP